jgi:hypothetical protein
LAACSGSFACSDATRSTVATTDDPQATPAIDLLGYRALLDDGHGGILPQFDTGAMPYLRVHGDPPADWGAALVSPASRIDLPFLPPDRRGSFTILTTTVPKNKVMMIDGELEVRRGTASEAARIVKKWPARWAPPPEEHPALAQYRALVARGAMDDAAEELRRVVAERDPATRTWAKIELAKLSKSRGDNEQTIAAWKDAAQGALEDGLPSEATRAWRAAAYWCFLDGRVLDVEPLLSRSEEVDRKIDNTLGLVRSQLYRGNLEKELGDYRAAIAALRSGVELAWSLGLDFEALMHSKALAQALQDEGLHQQALDQLDKSSSYFQYRAKREHKLEYLTVLGWVLLRGMAQGAFPKDYARAQKIEEEARSLAVAIRSPQNEANIVANLAWIADLQGDRTEAHRLLDDYRRLDPSQHGYAAIFAAWLEAKLLLDEGRLQASDARFARVMQLSQVEFGNQDTDFTWRATYGRGQIRAASGDRSGALEYYRAALAAVERLAAHTEIQTARAPFFDDRRHLVEDTLELLLERGAVREAFRIEDAAEARVLRALDTRVRVERLSSEKRAEWQARVGRYLSLRDEFERGRAQLEKLGKSGRAKLEAKRAEARTALEHAFDGAYAILDEGAPSFVAVAAPADDVARALREDEALIVFSRVHERASFFFAQGGAIRHVWMKEEDLSPWSTLFSRARHLYVVPNGMPTAYALPSLAIEKGEILIERTSVSFLPNASALLRLGPPPAGVALVVADPSSNLPFAREEGTLVHDALREARLMMGDEARRSAILEHLDGAHLFHFAGHGAVQAEHPWDAHIELAGGETLSLEDLLIARPRVGVVVLSGCETGKEEALSHSERVGLPEAFLLAGAHAVLATTEVVKDERALRFIRRFYQADGAKTPAAAARIASIASIDDNDDVWKAFRVTGGR